MYLAESKVYRDLEIINLDIVPNWSPYLGIKEKAPGFPGALPFIMVANLAITPMPSHFISLVSIRLPIFEPLQSGQESSF